MTQKWSVRLCGFEALQPKLDRRLAELAGNYEGTFPSFLYISIFSYFSSFFLSEEVCHPKCKSSPRLRVSIRDVMRCMLRIRRVDHMDSRPMPSGSATFLARRG